MSQRSDNRNYKTCKDFFHIVFIQDVHLACEKQSSIVQELSVFQIATCFK